VGDVVGRGVGTWWARSGDVVGAVVSGCSSRQRLSGEMGRCRAINDGAGEVASLPRRWVPHQAESRALCPTVTIQYATPRVRCSPWAHRRRSGRAGRYHGLPLTSRMIARCDEEAEMVEPLTRRPTMRRSLNQILRDRPDREWATAGVQVFLGVIPPGMSGPTGSPHALNPRLVGVSGSGTIETGTRVLSRGTI